MNKTLKKTALAMALGLGLSCCALPFLGCNNAVKTKADSFQGVGPLTEYTLGYGGNLYQTFTTQPADQTGTNGVYQYEAYYPKYYSTVSSAEYYYLAELLLEPDVGEVAFEYYYPNNSNYYQDYTSVKMYTTPYDEDDTLYNFTYNFGESTFLTSLQYEQWRSSHIHLATPTNGVIDVVSVQLNLYQRNEYGKIVLNYQTISLPVVNGDVYLANYLPTLDELTASKRTFYTASGGGILGAVYLHIEGTMTLDSQFDVELRRNYGSTNSSTYASNYTQAMYAFKDTPDVENNPVSVVLTPVEAFLQTEIFPDFTFGHILLMALGLAVLMIALKIFLGG